MTAWLFVTMLICGCRKAEPPAAHPTGTLRIVSMSPAISRTLVDFGVEGKVVGRSAWCASLEAAIPVVGDLYDIDYERLIRLEPTHVLVQPPSTGLDPTLERLADERGWIIGQWQFDTIDDIEQMVRDVPGVLYPQGGVSREAATARAADLLNRMAMALSPGPAAPWTGSTLLVADTDPAILVFGLETYLNDVLVSLGGRNAATTSGWSELSLEDIIRLDPEAIILVRDRGPADIDPVEAAGPLALLDTAARRDGRIAVLWHADAMLPSTAVIGVAEKMAKLLDRMGTAP
jgi:ABC-type hemin transport system substrate-binding protein